MLASAVITTFEQYVDDATELSSTQELALLQKIFNHVWSERPWEFAKTSVAGTFALTVPNIPKPTDFHSFVENNLFTDDTQSPQNNAAAKVIFIGVSYSAYQIINWSDRRQYRNQSGYAYLDLPNNGITFTATPAATDTYEFDYKKLAPTLTLVTDLSSYFPADFHDMLYHGMAIDDEICLRFPRANSYAPDNKAKFDGYLADMALWNASLNVN